jgi:mycothiol synthase
LKVENQSLFLSYTKITTHIIIKKKSKILRSKDMNIEYLYQSKLPDFISYCKDHRSEVDDSLLYDEDLAHFSPNEENPTYILLDDEAKIIGTVSLSIDAYHKRGKKARIRIMHCSIPEFEYYELMLKAILKHTSDLKNIFLFIKEENTAVADIFEKLAFSIERYSYVLIRPAVDNIKPSFPEGYHLEVFQPGKDEETWCKIRNAAFSKLAGSTTPMTPDMINKMLSSENHLSAGMLILYHEETPVGIVRGTKEFEDGEFLTFIGPLALIPEYQHKGLGRNLLRAAISFGAKIDMPKTMLTVNAENQRALELYLKEGFEKIEAVVCYNYDIN